MKIEVTEQEIQALAGLLDAAVRATGLRGASDAAVWAAKLEAALKAAKAEAAAAAEQPQA